MPYRRAQRKSYPELLPEFRSGGCFGGRQAGIGLFDAFLLSFGAADPRMSQEKERGEKKKKKEKRENPDFEFDCVAPRRVREEILRNGHTHMDF